MQAFLRSWSEQANTIELAGGQVTSGFITSEVRELWQALLSQAQAGELEHWQQSPPGVLGLILLYTHIPSALGLGPIERHRYKARALCLAGIRRGFDTQLNLEQRRSFYAPLFDSDDEEDRELLGRLLAGMRAQAADSDPARCRLGDWHAWWQQAGLQSASASS